MRNFSPELLENEWTVTEHLLEAEHVKMFKHEISATIIKNIESKLFRKTIKEQFIMLENFPLEFFVFGHFRHH